MPGHRKLGRETAHRKSMLRGMVTYLIEHGKIETTVTRAKEISSLTDHLISLSVKGYNHEQTLEKGKNKDNSNDAQRRIFNYLTKDDVAKKLVKEIAARYLDRKGGFTRIIKIGPRRGDGAPMAIIELV